MVQTKSHSETVVERRDRLAEQSPIAFTGPTTRRPLPEAEHRSAITDDVTGDRLDKRELQETGLAPEDFEREPDTPGAKNRRRKDRNAFRAVMSSLHASASMRPGGPPVHMQDSRRSL